MFAQVAEVGPEAFLSNLLYYSLIKLGLTPNLTKMELGHAQKRLVFLMMRMNSSSLISPSPSRSASSIIS